MPEEQDDIQDEESKVSGSMYLVLIPNHGPVELHQYEDFAEGANAVHEWTQRKQAGEFIGEMLSFTGYYNRMSECQAVRSFHTPDGAVVLGDGDTASLPLTGIEPIVHA